MQTYTSQRGDTWDTISKKIYGDEHYMDAIIRANIWLRKTVIFPYGVSLVLPDIDTASSSYDTNLPPWKRGGEP